MESIEQLISKKLNKLITSQYCELCDVAIDNARIAKDHYNGRRHKSNIMWFREDERARLLLEKNSYVPSSQDFPPLQKQNPPVFIESSKIFCKACNEWISSQDEFTKHNGTEAHQTNVDCYCELCSIFTPTKDHMWDHLKGKHHKNRLEEEGRLPIDGEFSPFCSSLSNNELKRLMLVDSCNVCNIKIPNIKRCVTHYISKSHEIAVEKWLQANQEIANLSEPAEEIADEAKSVEEVANEAKSIEENVEYYCFVCRLPFKDRHQHVNSFPHLILCREKQELVKKGVSDVYLTENQGSINCTLCKISLYSFHVVIDHTNSAKHIRNCLDWLCTAKKVTQKSEVERFYCKVCNEDLDGTSYADRHYEEESHSNKLALYCKTCDVSSATSELLVLHNNTFHSEKVQPNEILVITPWPPKFPDIVIPKNYTNITDNDNYSSPSPAGTSFTTTSNDNDQIVEENVASPTNDTEGTYCYLCDVLLFKKEKDRHVQSFPHSELSKEKERLLKEGISDVYLTDCVDGIKCELCSVILCNSLELGQHTNSLRHSDKYFSWRLNAKEVTSESEVEPFYCKVCDQGLDGTSCTEQHYTNKYHTELCNVSNATDLHHSENEQKDSKINSKSDTLTISYTDFITLLSTTYGYCDNVIDTTDKNSENAQSSIALTETKDVEDSGNLKNKVFNELEKLVQKLYYSKQVPYDFGLKYLQKINKEVDEIIIARNDDKEKQAFSVELDACFNNYYNNESEIAPKDEDDDGLFDEYKPLHSKKSEAVDSQIAIKTLEPDAFCKNAVLETFNQNIEKSLENEPPQTQSISDLLNEITNRNQDVVDLVEKGMLSEIEFLLKRIDDIEKGPVLEEILKSLQGFNEELDAASGFDANGQEINSSARRKNDDNNVEKATNFAQPLYTNPQQVEKSKNLHSYYSVLTTILNYGLCRRLSTKFNLMYCDKQANI